jgi:hypothetical protein
MSTPNHIEGRQAIIDALCAELVGPVPGSPALPGDQLDFSRPVSFETREESYGPWVQAGTLEEVLQRDRPTKRYGAGVLYPKRLLLPDGNENDAAEIAFADDELDESQSFASAAVDEINQIAERRGRGEGDSDDFDLTTANAYRPSSMAVTFLADLPPGSEVRVEASGGRYSSRKVRVAGQEREWWLRSPVRVVASFSGADLLTPVARLRKPTVVEAPGSEGLQLDFSAFTRPWQDPGQALITVALSNETDAGAQSPDRACLFQCQFRVVITAPGQSALVRPYPNRKTESGDEEEESFDLLYRHAQTYAIGHGCAADWGPPSADRVGWVGAEPLPVVQTPNITPEIERSDGTRLRVSMAQLAGLDGERDSSAILEDVASAYESWIDARAGEIPSLPGQHRSAAERHVSECREALVRIREGIELLGSDERVARAFRLANEAILLQQLRGLPTPRPVSVGSDGRYSVSPPLVVPDWRDSAERGWWRPFQIAFILSTLASATDPAHVDRRTVELIWFPTGGGKTEAYLGLAAFSLFHRRLVDPDDHGVEVLMRYTLRLLTSQQFQRASALICSMEHLRTREDDLGEVPFSIGIWLGNSVTPGTRSDAQASLKKLNKGDKYAENPFALLRCPWCSAQMGPLGSEVKLPRGTPRVVGYVERDGTVRFECPDRKCDFAKGLPVYVIDEDIYKARPSMIIGTVDKFAMLAWRPDARSLFGLEDDGSRCTSPPGTIIQDELHLISGPLGSVVGLYETVIEELCTDRRGGGARVPKIVSSTATIRRYEEQILGLYGRDRVALFPPRGLDASDSFFARYARERDGSLTPGRIFVGVNAPGLGSFQTSQVRTFSALLQAPMPMDAPARDPWWTLLIFFNSLRELGTSLSLLQSDIPDYLLAMRNRLGLDNRAIRYLRHVKELTSRLRSDEIPKAIDLLSVRASEDDPVDVCLSSSIIEVGIDIDRLSLMAVLGQPKTTSQYIQVTGRVGRRWFERPGLVVTIFSASKPRDRSHFEKFRSYHERLYAQVEPTSVTPFAPPVLDRALHAAVVAYIRQTGPKGLSPWPIPDDLVGRAMDLLIERAEVADQAEVANLKEMLTRRLAEWRRWERTSWVASTQEREQFPLLRRAGEWVPPAAARMSWATPTSMRNVDAECIAEVTLRYAMEVGETDE